MSLSNSKSPGTAVVTGASSGIGEVYAQRLAARGYDLLLVARREDRLNALATTLRVQHGVKVDVLAADLADAAGITRVSDVLQGHDGITLLVNNAGTSSVDQVAQMSLESITTLVTLNVISLTALTRAVLPRFLEKNAGTIINIGSVVGFAGYGWVPVYGATKAYVQNFTQALRLQLAESSIRLQYVAPSATVSEIWDAMGISTNSLGEGVLMTTENCVDAALKGLDAGEFITAPSVHDPALVKSFEDAATALLASTQTSVPAPRYGLSS